LSGDSPLRQQLQRLWLRYWWAVPFLASLAFYWRTLGTWFRADDFAWLGLRLSVHQPSDLWTVLFAPMAQGTVRFLSERAFFLTLESLFGLEALPFRVVIVGAQCISCVLLALVTRKLTGSKVAGVLAALFWTVSVGLSAAMGWMSSGNQIFCAAAILGTLWLFLDRRMVACWVVFLLGFGTLESMVVFPALALAWALLYDRTRWRPAAALTVPSLVFLVLHFAVIPKAATDPAYLLHLDPRSLAATLGTYLVWAFPVSAVAGLALVWLRNRPALFGALWFLALLAPVLPLRDHTLHYYLAVPLMALGFLAGLLCVCLPRPLMALVAVGLVAGSWVPARRAFYWQKEKARAVQQLVRGVQAARQQHPDRVILLTGISNELFWDGVFDNPFRLSGLKEIYLAPGAEKQIDAHPEWGGISQWLLGPAQVKELFEQERVAVYQPSGDSLRNVTASFRVQAERLGDALAAFVDVADPKFSQQVGAGWYAPENGMRWMGARATLQVNAQVAPAGLIELQGYAPQALGTIQLTVFADGVEAGQQSLTGTDQQFVLTYPLPPSAKGRAAVELAIQASRTFTPAQDQRQLSVVFGRIGVR
jgi:hypothetical protein